ncbi:helix-turn-helix transcriptional regulator [Janthinobacterium sp. SUN118]|uniref:helix-turn-helix transcriptional regulator n=1 Tax=Janthinobacterium sp. SUN118 TaxID=3004100 RepID=UPI0025B1C46A|nr:helix-turn-helix transcriptional regulator [Janthinobacterium sp. SUN118]MDN2710348.1 helix-turn-helix transcriptional regulator [Janthinobacterium sp. SUN118]
MTAPGQVRCVSGELIGKLLDAAGDDACWPQLCDDIARAFDAACATLTVCGDAPAGQLLGGIAPPADTGQLLGAIVPICAHHTAVLAIYGHRTPQEIEWRARRQLQAFLPHLQRALRLRQRLQDDSLASRCGMAALEAMGAAVLLLDARLGVLFANSGGHALLDAPLRIGPPPALARAVRVVIASMDGAAQCQSLRLPRSQACALVLTVAPFPAWHVPCAIVIARDPSLQSTSVPALRQLFDLTQAEAQVGQALAQGATIVEIATRCGISVNTVKTHLHHTYLKTDTRRQGELIALIHGATAHLANLDA